MSSPRNDEYESKTEETAIFGSSEKNAVLKIAHTDLLPMILHAISAKYVSNNKDLTFEDVLDASPALLEDYRTLRAFDGINNLIRHKNKIQMLIHDYIDQVLAGCRMANEQGFAAFIISMKNAFGLSALLKVYEQMLNNQNYPTSLEMPDVDNKALKSAIHALDIFLHLPDSLKDTNPLARNISGFITQQMKNVMANPSKAYTEKKQPDSSAFHQQPKSKAAPKQKPAANPAFSFKGNANNYSSDQIFNQFFGGLNLQMSQMDKYAKNMKSYKSDILGHNSISNCNIFYGIATGADFVKIQKYLETTANARQIKDGDGNSALHLAALCGRADVVGLLIERYGFDPDEKNTKGNTALHLGVLSENSETVRTLVRAGANVNLDNNDRVDAMILAMHCKANESITGILIESRSFNPGKTY